MSLPVDFDKTWYVARTLLGGITADGRYVDRNRQSLYRGEELIATFNQSMQEWSDENARALSDIMSYLNRHFKVDKSA